MFYSQFILAKKGPLGTIWIAAHLERKLRRNQVHETNITTSVDSILFPEVPIALRLSGHLLLGVVRIYSRKVTYLFQDCNEALHKLKCAFAAANSAPSAIDLPSDQSTAPFHSITLPETFEFEELEPGVDAFVADDCFDHHVCARDKITLDEPVIEEDVGLQFESEERFAPTPCTMDIGDQGFPSSTSVPPDLQEDVLPPMDMAGLVDTYPDIEKLRSVPDTSEDAHGFEKQDVLQSEPSMADVLIGSGHPEDNHLVEDEQPVPSTPSTRQEAASPEDATPALAVVETPVSERKKGTRKRKHLLDAQSTLSESYMKEMLKDSSDIRRVRRKVANTPERIWMFEKEILGKRMFDKPSVCGLCSSLEVLYEQAFNPKRQKTSGSTANVSDRVVPDTVPASPNRQQLPGSPVPVPGSPAPMPSPVPPSLQSLEHMNTPKQRDDQTPHTPFYDFGTPAGATPDQNSEPRNEGGQASTAARNERTSPVQSAAHEAELEQPAPMPSGPAIESSFLDEANSEGSQTEGWSSRTRAIALFLQAAFEKESPNVSMEGLVRGKTRKEAARMFFETLVLSTNDYISVEQGAPFKDVTLHARPKLIKAVF